MAQPIGAYTHITGDTTNQTNVPGAPATGCTLVKVVINRPAAAATTLTLKDGTAVVAIIAADAVAGSVFDYSVQLAGQLSRTWSATNVTQDVTLVIA